MTRHLLYIINPISGTGKKQKLRELIETKTAAAGFDHSIYPSVANGDYSFLNDTIVEKKITDIIIAGGDGTVSQVVGSLMHHPVCFGIIPCGSGNGLAYAAGIPKKPEAALQLIFKGKAQPTDGFYINDQFACMLAGLGFDAKVAHDFAQQPGRGLSNYIKMVVLNYFSATTYPFELIVNDRLIHTEAYFISIANSNQFGNNFTIAPMASLRDGLLDIVIVTRQNKLALLLKVLSQIRGKIELQTQELIDGTKAVVYFQTSALQIKNTSEAPLHIDGDPVDSSLECSIRVAPSCFRLICAT